MSQKIDRVIRQYAKVIKVDEDSVRKAYEKNSNKQKEIDLFAMRVTIFLANENKKEKLTPERQKELIEFYLKNNYVPKLPKLLLQKELKNISIEDLEKYRPVIVDESSTTKESTT